jgi:hypothetical protein
LINLASRIESDRKCDTVLKDIASKSSLQTVNVESNVESIKECGICQYTLSSCVGANEKLNNSLAEIIIDKSLLQAQILELNSSHTSQINKLTNEYGICQSILSSCIKNNENLNASLAEMNSRTQCKTQRTPSSTSDLNQLSEEKWQKINNNPKDCSEIFLSRKAESGVYNIYPDGNLVQVYCDMDTDGGGWTVVLQRGKRGIHRADFYKNWNQYERGFGDFTGGDYNIGLKSLYALTSLQDQELRVELSDWQGYSAYANYKTFWIGDANEKYKLMVGNYSGNAGDSLAPHNGEKFTTFDQDNDSNGGNCAVSYGGAAWWFNNCATSSLNGKYFNVETMDHKGVYWYHWKINRLSMKTAEMKKL